MQGSAKPKPNRRQTLLHFGRQTDSRQASHDSEPASIEGIEAFAAHQNEQTMLDIDIDRTMMPRFKDHFSSGDRRFVLSGSSASSTSLEVNTLSVTGQHAAQQRYQTSSRYHRTKTSLGPASVELEPPAAVGEGRRWGKGIAANVWNPLRLGSTGQTAIPRPIRCDCCRVSTEMAAPQNWPRRLPETLPIQSTLANTRGSILHQAQCLAAQAGPAPNHDNVQPSSHSSPTMSPPTALRAKTNGVDQQNASQHVFEQV